MRICKDEESDRVATTKVFAKTNKIRTQLRQLGFYFNLPWPSSTRLGGRIVDSCSSRIYKQKQIKCCWLSKKNIMLKCHFLLLLFEMDNDYDNNRLILK